MIRLSLHFSLGITNIVEHTVIIVVFELFQNNNKFTTDTVQLRNASLKEFIN